MIRNLVLAAAVTLVAAPAMADMSDTLAAVTTKGVVLTTQGYGIAITYAEDGTYSGDAMGTVFTGKWRAEGDELCTSSSMSPTETCTTYPEGKGAGDSFEVTNPTLGKVAVKINE